MRRRRVHSGTSCAGVWLIAFLAGVGFTMSIFIAILAFADADLLAAAKLGVLLGPLVSASLGLGWGAWCAGQLRRDSQELASRA